MSFPVRKRKKYLECAVSGCGNRATFGPKNGKVHVCGDHRRDYPAYVNLSRPWCQHTLCMRVALYAAMGRRRPTHCVDHKGPDMLTAAQMRKQTVALAQQTGKRECV